MDLLSKSAQYTLALSHLYNLRLYPTSNLKVRI